MLWHVQRLCGSRAHQAGCIARVGVTIKIGEDAQVLIRGAHEWPLQCT